MVFERLKKKFPGMRKNEPLAKHCNFKVGGPADLFYELHNVEELPALIEATEEAGLAYFMFGQGSNILFLDGGFRGLAIKNMSNRIAVDGNDLTADSGISFGMLIQKSLQHNLTGLEPFFGIPGSIGGAVYGNAGVPGHEISEFVKSVEVCSVDEGVRTLRKKDLNFSYRESSLKNSDNFIVSVTLSLKPGDQNLSREEMKKIDEIRRGKQPSGYTCGSFFKNPSPDKPAGMLIDKAGLKGTCIGGAQISEKHGNFFMNVHKATAKDILDLSDIAKKTVFEKFGVKLKEEVRIIGKN